MGGESTERWLVRIRESGESGEPLRPVLGAGLLLDSHHVLTCAHLLGDPEVRVRVEAARGYGRIESVPATVTDDGWIPRLDGDAYWGRIGDLALLRLERPLPAEWATVLHRLAPTRHRRVRLHGFPDHVERGFELEGHLGGPPGGDGRVQVHPDQHGAVVVAGFSGGAVVDRETGRVIGMVASRVKDEELGASFMIPVDTMIQYLPQLDPYVRGDSAADRGLLSEGVHRSEDEDVGLAQVLARWLGDVGSAPVQAVRVAPYDHTRTQPLRRAISVATRSMPARHRAERLTDLPPGTIPPVGSLDLAVDATRKTRAAVAERIADRVGVRSGPGETPEDGLRRRPLPLTIAVHGVDRAADPADLVALLGVLAERGSRMLLVFHGDDPAARDTIVACLDFHFRFGAVARELTACADLARRGLPERLRRVKDNEEPAARSVREAAGTFAVVVRAERTVAALRTGDQGARSAWTPESSAALLADLARARALLDRAVDDLDDLSAERDDLRGLLLAAHAGVRGAPGGPDSPAPSRWALDLSDRYIEARDLLWRGPCDVPEARVAVGRYLEALQRKGTR
ncbi:S1 family peptidase [Streptomyces radicis]|uniref:Serine protease n=1 Tax=Streptomyces radicis TaxID=1750517 RepID=A0A3A9VUS0_9ACTN|nr:serine protease [Streptomyces radicis]RKN04755.1 serine protease [Streptomyces radicis]RKN15961.1 serine protease [Streptomyces radicis]